MKTLFSDNPTIDGLEAMSITERMKVFFTDVSLGIDKLNASIFNSSIHTVDYKVVVGGLKKANYFEYSTNQIPTPVFFNSGKGTFREYIAFCVSGPGLLTVADGECERLYAAFKRIAGSGEVPFAIRHWDLQKTLDDVKLKADKNFSGDNPSSAPINAVYRNVAEIEDNFKYFNDSVKMLKSRDVEIMAKKVDNFIDIVKLIKRKIDAGDLKFSPDEIMTMECAIQRLSELVSITGILMSRLNELTRVMELQVDEFKRYAK